MSEPLLGVVICHRGLAGALVEATVAVTGIADGLVPVTNDGCDTPALFERIARVVAGRPAVLFVDLPGGSCRMGAALAARGHRDVAVVSGASLPMLLDFVFHRDATPAAAATRAAEVGVRGITTAVGG